VPGGGAADVSRRGKGGRRRKKGIDLLGCGMRGVSLIFSRLGKTWPVDFTKVCHHVSVLSLLILRNSLKDILPAKIFYLFFQP